MKYYLATISALVGIFIIAGCIKRTETVAILPDGSAHLLTQAEGDPEDFADGDPMPSRSAGWRVQERTVKEAASKQEKHYLTATLRVPAGSPIPDAYAELNDPVEDVCLRFPTDITIERKPDGVYYHYRRSYEGRPFARLNYWRDAILETDEIKKIQAQPPEDLTNDDRLKLATALIEIETQQAAEFLEEAALELSHSINQHQWLAARKALVQTYQSETIKQKVAEILEPENGQVEADDLAEDTRARAAQKVSDVLLKKGVNPTVINDFFDAYHLARERFDITQDIADEDWTHSVILPGNIIAHNSSSESESVDIAAVRKNDDTSELGDTLAATRFEPGYTQVNWSFNAKALRDRDMTLAATSFVPNEQ